MLNTPRQVVSAMEALLRSEAWNHIATELNARLESELEQLVERSIPPDDRSYAAGRVAAIREFLDLPGTMHQDAQNKT